MPDVILYTRRGCHLCDDAHSLLLRHGISPRLVDIDADQALQQRYNECVPVVTIDGKVRFRGPVNEVLLKRLLRHLSSREASSQSASCHA
jgi:glutaredoxin